MITQNDWFVLQTPGCAYYQIRAQGDPKLHHNPCIAETVENHEGVDAEANAHLLAAAPALLRALQMFVTEYEGNGHDEREDRPEMKAARAAIAKAKR